MLTLDQIPEPVWRRVQKLTGRTDEHFCKCLAAEVVAAWPGVDYRPGTKVTKTWRDPGKIILPMPTENPNAES